MALVKKTAVISDAPAHISARTTAKAKPAANHPTAVASRSVEAQRRQARTFARQQQAAERISAATTELAGGVAEAASAGADLKRAMDEIAAGAEEASAAAAVSLRAVSEMAGILANSREAADLSVNKTNELQALALETRAQLAKSVAAIARATERQQNSVRIATELESQATNTQ